MARKRMIRLHCDQCEMLAINGYPCHETGCPNARSRWDEESQTWIRQFKCFNCGCDADVDTGCDCMVPIEDGAE